MEVSANSQGGLTITGAQAELRSALMPGCAAEIAQQKDEIRGLTEELEQMEADGRGMDAKNQELTEQLDDLREVKALREEVSSLRKALRAAVPYLLKDIG